jgi:hypothetical protein
VGTVAVLAALGCMLSGCVSNEALSPAGARVAVIRTPMASCESIGYLVGTGGGSVGGGWIANQDLIGFAINDLRNQAAALGATHVQMEPPQLGQSGGTTSTATVTGTAYRCGP